MYEYAVFSDRGNHVVARCVRSAASRQASTAGEGHERRYFYGSVWAVTIAQPILLVMWKVMPRGTVYDAVKFAVFVGV